MTVRVDEDAGIAAPEGLAAFAGDPGPGGPRLLEHRVDVLGRARVVCRRDAAANAGPSGLATRSPSPAKARPRSRRSHANKPPATGGARGEPRFPAPLNA